ncbi:hypothetical protein VTN96DRAFT_9865 [Rasamsonia emersonii]|uniref:Uncharacterized protein n=1 Tax=Rasamsonia emersonii (strain ATCC 16479 / CBS 393.64 / IMI 116815) TaxID=1408163 RepID=A0A0F4YIB4_RASE3|nr:hypothetical protein T310_8449 [Rasamsonia emersonii CBS 393.64]KKA17611.1 hypothetical protein T310_8449 [Rasamsonia emersonii CBS 393.64]
MSATTTAVSATSTASTTCNAQVYEIPTKDAACAVPAQGGSNYADAMKTCCHSASVQSYDNNCGLYCLAQGQTVGNLTSCLMGHGVDSAHVFCNQNQTATATETASASKETGSSSTSGTSTGSSATATSSKSAAVAAKTVSKSGLGVLALLFCSSLLGAVA